MFQIHFDSISTNFEVYHIFYVVLAVLGIYLIYSVRNMKKKGEISAFIISLEDLEKCRNKKGFINETANSMLVFGIITLLYGIFGIANSFLSAFGWGYEVLGISEFLIVYGWFSKELIKGIQKYCK